MLHIENLKKVYGKNVILNGISLDIQDGEIVSVLGAAALLLASYKEPGPPSLKRSVTWAVFWKVFTIIIIGGIDTQRAY